jgi:hypothetical protein
MSEPIYTRATLPSEGWATYRKRSLTRARRVEGPFLVETPQGPLRCQDGWLALDANGDPYPIAADVFDATYRAVE